ncbi:serine/threonine-protein kinase [Paraliomyxa miuraensis]|uniref:serine/threonine-protein kinase n=1 Tax=Paraliomyxa miuraensis TaxID=376150 RepID=UPI002257E4FC|nr:serine/threonine-protein kinase [Paraliomyxa miuraensis]MCX4244390.1 serine/threonine-protein kinase [Paraliomyxa miuraensis]
MSATREMDGPPGSHGQDYAVELDHVGRYRFLECVATGGMGVVFRAYDPKLERDVAVKLLKGDASAFGRARLLQEARLMAKLDHPNIVAVHDVGEHEDRIFIAMDLVVGQTLRTWFAEEHTWEEILSTMIEAGQGLAAAHALGIVHRDFKPENVLVDQHGRVRVTDFGVALAHEVPTEAIGPTAPALVLDQGSSTAPTRYGTPEYMAPEQFCGMTVGPVADQFSFCMTLWEGLFGERPFSATNLAAGALELRVGVSRLPRGSRLPKRVQHALRRGLRLAPDERWPSMDALLGELISARATSRRSLLAAGALLTAATGGLVATLAQLDPGCESTTSALATVWNPDRDVVLHQSFSRTGVLFAEDAAERASGRIDDYARRWGELRLENCDGHQRGDRSDELFDLSVACLDDRLSALETRLAVFDDADAITVENSMDVVLGLPRLDECLEAKVLRSGPEPPPESLAATVRSLRDTLQQAISLRESGHYERAIELAQQVVGDDASLAYFPLRAEGLLELGRSQSRSTFPSEARRSLEMSHDAATQAKHDSLAAEASVGLVYVLATQLHRLDDAETWVGRAEAWIERTDAPLHLRASFLTHRALLALERGEFDAACALFRQAIDTQLTAQDIHPLSLSSKYNNLGLALERAGHSEEAIAAHTKALELRQEILGEHHPDIATSHMQLGNVFNQQHDYTRARQELELALASFQSTVGEAHHATAAAHTNLGLVLQRQGELPLALAQHYAARESYAAAGGDRRVELGQVALNVATALGDQGKHAEALEENLLALRLFQDALPPEHPFIGHTFHNIGREQLALGDIEASLEAEQEAQRIWETRNGPQFPNLVYSLSGIGEALHRLGRLDEALVPLERAIVVGEQSDGDPAGLMWARLVLARVLDERGGSEERVHALAKSALDWLDASGANDPEARPELERLLDPLR